MLCRLVGSGLGITSLLVLYSTRTHPAATHTSPTTPMAIRLALDSFVLHIETAPPPPCATGPEAQLAKAWRETLALVLLVVYSKHWCCPGPLKLVELSTHTEPFCAAQHKSVTFHRPAAHTVCHSLRGSFHVGPWTAPGEPLTVGTVEPGCHALLVVEGAGADDDIVLRGEEWRMLDAAQARYLSRLERGGSGG